MGWLWNVEAAGLTRNNRCGWKPGAVRKSVAKIMAFHTFKAPKHTAECESDPPTLRVHKKDGEYTIIMNPLRDGEKSNVDPSPIVFKITKSDDAKARAKAREILKTRGVEMKCECGTVEECKCLNECQKAVFKLEMAKISNQLCIKPELTACDLRLSSDSEIDIEFTPPNATRQAKPVKVSYAETQYENMLEVTKACDDGLKEDKSDGDKPQGGKVKVKGDKVKDNKSESKAGKTKGKVEKEAKKKEPKKGAKSGGAGDGVDGGKKDKKPKTNKK